MAGVEERPDPLAETRASLRADPTAARFVWHSPDAPFDEYRCHNTILHLVVSGMYDTPDHIALAAMLLEFGADPNARNDDGRTPLHYACDIGSRDVELVRLLLQHGADPNARDNRQRTPMSLAWGQSREPTAIRELLAEYGGGAAAEPGAAADRGLHSDS
ncbi:ankyrin repeat domain-containing protein [bacterium]|nr:ankyrin repeat domain-containing protein [bacterium]